MTGIGFFAPLPLAIMIPFMASQSLAMGEAFGKGFQYGKRKISSLTNEEFNALNPEDLGSDVMTDYRAMIPHIKKAMEDSKEFQTIIIQSLTGTVLSIPKDVVEHLQTSVSRDSIEDLLFSKPNPEQDIGLQIQEAFKKFALGDKEQTAVAESSPEIATTHPVATKTKYSGWSLKQLSDRMRFYTVQGKTSAPPELVQEYQTRLAETKQTSPNPEQPSTKTLPQAPKMSRGDQTIHDTLIRRGKQYSDGMKLWRQYDNTIKTIDKIHKSAWSSAQTRARANAVSGKASLVRNLLRIIIPIFNSKLAQAKRIPSLQFWHSTKPLRIPI